MDSDEPVYVPPAHRSSVRLVRRKDSADRTGSQTSGSRELAHKFLITLVEREASDPRARHCEVRTPGSTTDDRVSLERTTEHLSRRSSPFTDRVSTRTQRDAPAWPAL